jgi:hypothetical protein
LRHPHKQRVFATEHFHAIFFLGIMQLLVEETNRFYHQYLEAAAEGHSPLPDVTLQETYLFLSIIAQMGCYQTDRLKDYWSTLEQFFMAF